MPSKLKKAIGAVKDQTSISLAKVSSNSTRSNLEVAVLKATTHDDEVPMDERYVQEILSLVSSDKAHAAACARAIGKRIGRTRNWVVAIKSLKLVLRIFQDGDPYFPREVLHAMKRGARILNLSSFRDDSNSSSPWDYTAFIRTFALYLDERLDCFLTGKLQRRRNTHTHDPHHHRTHSGMAYEPVHDMKPAMLLDKISYWQRLLDRAVATRPTGAAKMNRLVQISLYAIVQESFDLYKDISDGLALLLDSFFHLQYSSCINAFQACVKATKQFEELTAFYDLCKSMGVGRTSEYPSVQKISEELLETLQEFLKDQSSFPATKGSPNKPQLFLPASQSASGRHHDSYCSEQSEVTATTVTSMEHASGMGSRCTSLEDLIRATELSSGKDRRPISIDLEAYSITDHELEKLQSDGTYSGNDDAGSTRSMPISSSIVDLLDEWTSKDGQDEDEEAGEENKQEKAQHLPAPDQQQQQAIEQIQRTGWELVLFEGATTSTTTIIEQLPSSFMPNGVEDLLIQNQKAVKASEPISHSEGWELVLAETVTPLSIQLPPNMADIECVSHVQDSCQQISVLPQVQYYNPFLQDEPEMAVIPAAAPALSKAATGFPATFSANETIFAVPTFQAAPTFWAGNPNEGTIGFHGEPDPFASYPRVTSGSADDCDQGFGRPLNPQNLLQEQQLWLQQQNKIIARYMP